MKVLILGSLVAIFVVGGIGLIFSLSEVSEQKSYHLEQWLIEYEYSPYSFPKDHVEKILYGTTDLWGIKFKIIHIESVSDITKNMNPLLQDRFFGDGEIKEDMYIFTINGSWDEHKEDIKRSFEEIDGVKSVRHFTSIVA